MENPFEILEQRFASMLAESERRILAQIATREHKPGIDLEKYISLKKVAEIYGVASKTLLAHKIEIDHVKRFGQIYFVKQSLAEYMEGGRAEVKRKGVMYTNYSRRTK